MSFDNPNQKGNFGLGAAINYYTSKGYIVSLPLNDNQDYDLIVDIEGELKKVQVKTAFTKKNNNYKVFLRTITSSTTGVKNIKKFSEVKCDYLFILTSDGTMYEIIKSEILQNAGLTLNSDKDKFIVGKVNIN